MHLRSSWVGVACLNHSEHNKLYRLILAEAKYESVVIQEYDHTSSIHHTQDTQVRIKHEILPILQIFSKESGGIK